MGHIDRDRHGSRHSFVEGHGSERANREGGVRIRLEDEAAVNSIPRVLAPGQERFPQLGASVQVVASELIASAACPKGTEEREVTAVNQALNDVQVSGIERDRGDPRHPSAPRKQRQNAAPPAGRARWLSYAGRRSSASARSNWRAARGRTIAP